MSNRITQAISALLAPRPSQDWRDDFGDRSPEALKNQISRLQAAAAEKDHRAPDHMALVVRFDLHFLLQSHTEQTIRIAKLEAENGRMLSALDAATAKVEKHRKKELKTPTQQELKSKLHKVWHKIGPQIIRRHKTETAQVSAILTHYELAAIKAGSGAPPPMPSEQIMRRWLREWRALPAKATTVDSQGED